MQGTEFDRSGLNNSLELIFIPTDEVGWWHSIGQRPSIRPFVRHPSVRFRNALINIMMMMIIIINNNFLLFCHSYIILAFQHIIDVDGINQHNPKRRI